MEIVSRDAILNFFDAAASTMHAQKDYLIALDAALGDGDLGLTMSTGFQKMKEAVHESTEVDLGKLLMLAGMTIAKAVPSTMGTLVGSGFMKAAKALKGKEVLQPADFATLVDAFVAGLMERGKASPGDRTIIDALYPAARSLEKSLADGASLSNMVADAAAAAEAGVEATKNMKAAFGRGVFFGDQVLGKPDQGAIVGMYIMQAWKTALCE